MDAEESQHGLTTAIPAIADFGVIPEALMRSSQLPAVGPTGQEGQDPSCKWAEGRPLLEIQQRDLRDVNDCATETMTSFPKDAPADVETNQENLMAEAWDTPECQEAVPQSPADRQARPLASPELWACSAQGDQLDMATVSSELSSRVEVEFRPELTSVMLGTGPAEEEEESSPDTSAQTRHSPSCEKHPPESNPPQGSKSGTIGQGEELQSVGVQESQGRGGLLWPQETEELEEQGQEEVEFQRGGTLGETMCSDELLGEQEQMGEKVNGTGGEQRQNQEQILDDVMLAKQREREEPNGELRDLNYDERERRTRGQEGLEQREQTKREFRGPQENRMDAQYEENQSLVGKSVNVTRRQEPQGPQGNVMLEEEPENWRGPIPGGVGGERSTDKGEERGGPPTPALVAPGVSSPCDLFPDAYNAMTRIHGTQTELRADELFPRAQNPTLEPMGQSRQPIYLPSSFPSGESPDHETAQDSQQEGCELGEGAVSSQGTEMASGGASMTPPSPAEVSPSTTAPSSASPAISIPRKKPSLAKGSPDTSRTSFLTNDPSPCGAADTLPAALHGCSLVEATMEPPGSPQSPLGSCAGAVQHLRSNSFPGSHRTQLAPDLAAISLYFSQSELPQRPPKSAIYGSVIPRRCKKSSRDCGIIPESPSSLSSLGQSSQEFPLNLGSTQQPWGSPQNSAFASGSPAYGSSPPLVFSDMRAHEPPPPPPPEKRHVHPSVAERESHLHAVVPTLRQCSYPPPLALSSGLRGPPKGPLPEVPDPLVARQYRPLPSTPDSPHQSRTSLSPRQRYNKPLPPTPDLSQFHQSPVFSDNSPRIYRPLPPIPIIDPLTEPPPLPPKSRGRGKSIQGGLMNSGGHAKPRPICQERTVSIPHSAGRTSWPPAMGRSTDSLASNSRSKSEVSSGMAFSNVTTLLSPSSPTTPWTLELEGPTSEPRLSEESEAHARGSFRRTAPQEEANGLRGSDLDQARQPEKPSHPHLEKASSWPHRRDPGRPPEGSSGQAAAVSAEGSSKHKGWHRQGLRRPSILPQGSSGEQGAWRHSCQSQLAPGLTTSCIFCPQGSYDSLYWLYSPTYPTQHRGEPLKAL